MPQFFIILFKINLALLLFGVAYYLVLRRLTFYRLNRAYLVVGILFSSVYPFIDLENFFLRHPAVHEQIQIIVPVLKTGAINWSWLFLPFLLGLSLFLTRLVIQFFSLYRIHNRSTPGLLEGFDVRILKDELSPFSFWKSVYINPSLHEGEKLKTILEHERIHVKEWHTIDILLTELSVVFYWFNPGVWMIKKAVKENLEFITDEQVLNLGINRKAYQYSLLEAGNLKPATLMVNNFNISDLKRRILMMNLKPSSAVSLGRYLLLVPVLLLVTLAFTVPPTDRKIPKLNIPTAATKPEKILNIKITEKPLVTRVVVSPPISAQKPKSLLTTVLKNKTAKTEKPALVIRRVAGVKIDERNEGSSAANERILPPVRPDAAPETPVKVLDEVVVTGYSTRAKTDSDLKPKDNEPLTTITVVGRKMTPEEIAANKKKLEENSAIKP